MSKNTTKTAINDSNPDSAMTWAQEINKWIGMQNDGLLTVKPILAPLDRQCMDESTNDLSYSSGVQMIPLGRLILNVVRSRSKIYTTTADRTAPKDGRQSSRVFQVPGRIVNKHC